MSHSNPGPRVAAATCSLTLAVAVFFAATGSGSATPAHPAAVDPLKCAIATGFPDAAGQGANQAPPEDAPPSKTCLRTKVQLLGASSSTLPKVGQSGRLSVTIQADSNFQSGKSRVRIRVPRGITPGTSPSGFSRSTLVDPFSKGARSGSWDDGSHSYAVTGTASIVAGRTTTITLPVTVSTAGAGSFEVEVGNPGDTSSQSVVTPSAQPGSSATATYTWSTAATTTGIRSTRSQAELENPPDWSVDSPGSFSIAGRQLTDWTPSTAANYSRPKTALDAQSQCPGKSGVPVNGVCPGVADLLQQGNANQVSRSARRASIRARAAGTSCLAGQLVYSDPAGVHPSANVPFKVYDVNSVIDDEIGSGITDYDGTFNVCFNNAENGYFESGTADAQLIFRSSNARFRVVNNCCAGSGWTPGTYDIEMPTRNNIPSGTTNLGAVTASDSNFQRAYHAYDLLNQAWSWSNSHSPGVGSCWANGDCNQKTIMWWPSSTEWPHYAGFCAARAGWIICLPGAGPDSSHVVLHEIGHNVMDDVFDGMPDHDCPDPHFGAVNEDAGCAWTEGWPSYYAATILDKAILSGYPNVNPPDFENLSWQTYNGNTSAGGIARGSNVENRVTSALWDLEDSNNEGAWDRMSLGDQTLWDAFRLSKPQSWNGMVAALNGRGVNTTGTDFLSTLYGNTIDMTSLIRFREPITNNVWLNRPLPPVSAPSLSSASMGGNSAAPTNTSNGHSFVWDRPTPVCTDTIEVQTLSGSSSYKSTDPQPASSPAYSYIGFTLTAFSNSNMTGQLATSSTGSFSLASYGSKTISLPSSPTRVYVTTSGATRGTPVSPGFANLLPENHYRLRAHRCITIDLAQPLAIDRALRTTSAIQLVGGRTYTATYTPSGKSTTGRSQQADIAVGTTGWSGACLEGANQGQGKCTPVTPIKSTSTTSSAAGRPVSLTFTPQQNAAFEFAVIAKAGPGSGTFTVKQTN